MKVSNILSNGDVAPQSLASNRGAHNISESPDETNQVSRPKQRTILVRKRSSPFQHTITMQTCLLLLAFAVTCIATVARREIKTLRSSDKDNPNWETFPKQLMQLKNDTYEWDSRVNNFISRIDVAGTVFVYAEENSEIIGCMMYHNLRDFYRTMYNVTSLFHDTLCLWENHQQHSKSIVWLDIMDIVVREMRADKIQTACMDVLDVQDYEDRRWLLDNMPQLYGTNSEPGFRLVHEQEMQGHGDPWFASCGKITTLFMNVFQATVYQKNTEKRETLLNEIIKRNEWKAARAMAEKERLANMQQSHKEVLPPKLPLKTKSDGNEIVAIPLDDAYLANTFYKAGYETERVSVYDVHVEPQKLKGRTDYKQLYGNKAFKRIDQMPHKWSFPQKDGFVRVHYLKESANHITEHIFTYRVAEEGVPPEGSNIRFSLTHPCLGLSNQQKSNHPYSEHKPERFECKQLRQYAEIDRAWKTELTKRQDQEKEQEEPEERSRRVTQKKIRKEQTAARRKKEKEQKAAEKIRRKQQKAAEKIRRKQEREQKAAEKIRRKQEREQKEADMSRQKIDRDIDEYYKNKQTHAEYDREQNELMRYEALKKAKQDVWKRNAVRAKRNEEMMRKREKAIEKPKTMCPFFNIDLEECVWDRYHGSSPKITWKAKTPEDFLFTLCHPITKKYWEFGEYLVDVLPLGFDPTFIHNYENWEQLSYNFKHNYPLKTCEDGLTFTQAKRHLALHRTLDFIDFLLARGYFNEYTEDQDSYGEEVLDKPFFECRYAINNEIAECDKRRKRKCKFHLEDMQYDKAHDMMLFFFAYFRYGSLMIDQADEWTNVYRSSKGGLQHPGKVLELHNDRKTLKELEEMSRRKWTLSDIHYLGKFTEEDEQRRSKEVPEDLIGLCFVERNSAQVFIVQGVERGDGNCIVKMENIASEVPKKCEYKDFMKQYKSMQ